MRIGFAHFPCTLLECLDRYQIALADSRTILLGFFQFFLISEYLRPKRERTALRWFGRMHRTSLRQEERTFSLKHTKADSVLCGINILTLKFIRAHADKCGQAGYVFLPQIDKSL